MIAFVFPGQGSQKRGMGQGLFDAVPQYAAVEQDVDALLGYSMRQLCLEDPHDHLKQTQYTQPSLYVVNALHYFQRMNQGQGQAMSQGIQPSFVAGHSLGEYNALLAAGAFDFLTGLRLVHKRGELMAAAKHGGMAAVIGLSAAKILQVLGDNGLTSIDVANFNSSSQIVVSGPLADLELAGPAFEKAGARMCIPLQVSAAFHSRYLAEAAGAFADFLAPLSFAAPSVTVIANVTAQPYPLEDPSAAIKSLLTRQITGSVQWMQSIQFLVAQGVKEFKELGPGNVLTKLVQQIHKEANA